MILLSVITSEGPQLAVKTTSGVLILADALVRQEVGELDAYLPSTLDEALSEPGSFERLIFNATAVHRRAAGLRDLARPEDELHVGLPIRPRNIICVGRNYKDHAIEAGVKIPERPMLFAKLSNSVIGPGEPIILPLDSAEIDYEAELAVVIGRRASCVPVEAALDYVAGYTCLNDVSARDFQRGDGQWLRAKSQDTFAPLGPYLVTREEIADPQTLRIRCWVNDQLRQNSNTSEMIFAVRDLIAFISRGMTLNPGDIISTGTPHGVGFARKPPIFLKDGDQVVVEVEGVGRLWNPVKRRRTHR